MSEREKSERPARVASTRTQVEGGRSGAGAAGQERAAESRAERPQAMAIGRRPKPKDRDAASFAGDRWISAPTPPAKPRSAPRPMTGMTDEVAAQSLQAAAEALAVPLTEAQLAQLLQYWRLLQRWNQVYNLTALRDPAEMISHHLVDCLAVLPALRRHAATVADRPLRVLDVGSGGGLPGVVLAILQPDWTVRCVDTVAKKAGFIGQVAAELALPNLRGVHARVETLVAPKDCADVITSRAFASLVDFTSLTTHLLAPAAVWAAMKGKTPEGEQAELPSGVEVFHVEPLTVPGLDAERCLVWMRPKG